MSAEANGGARRSASSSRGIPSSGCPSLTSVLPRLLQATQEPGWRAQNVGPHRLLARDKRPADGGWPRPAPTANGRSRQPPRRRISSARPPPRPGRTGRASANRPDGPPPRRCDSTRPAPGRGRGRGRAGKSPGRRGPSAGSRTGPGPRASASPAATASSGRSCTPSPSPDRPARIDRQESRAGRMALLR